MLIQDGIFAQVLSHYCMGQSLRDLVINWFSGSIQENPSKLSSPLESFSLNMRTTLTEVSPQVSEDLKALNQRGRVDFVIQVQWLIIATKSFREESSNYPISPRSEHTYDIGMTKMSPILFSRNYCSKVLRLCKIRDVDIKEH
jgi:hypothetical protein